MKTTILSIVIALLAGQPAFADGKKIVVVVAKGSSVTNLTRGELKRCFTSEPVTAGGKPLVPFNEAPNSAERIGFDRAVLGMTPDEVGRFWIDRKVRGQSAAPRSLPSAAHVAKVAAKFPGAIGYLTTDQLTSDVQVVSIDGLAYTDARYILTTP
jgi:hypothetical protein